MMQRREFLVTMSAAVSALALGGCKEQDSGTSTAIPVGESAQYRKSVGARACDAVLDTGSQSLVVGYRALRILEQFAEGLDAIRHVGVAEYGLPEQRLQAHRVKLAGHLKSFNR